MKHMGDALQLNGKGDFNQPAISEKNESNRKDKLTSKSPLLG